MRDRFDRQQFLGARSNEILQTLRVGVVGLGGGGSHIVQQLAHLGVSNLVLFDADIVEDTNLNRLVGATEDDVQNATPKVVVAERLARSVNRRSVIQGFQTVWQEHDDAVRLCNVVFGCLDRYDERRQLEAYCRRFLIPYIDIGMDVHRLEDRFAIAGQVILSMPGEPCLECMGYLREDLDTPRYGDAGAKPQVIWPNGILASLAVGVFVQLVTPWHPQHQRVIYLEFDGNSNQVRPSVAVAYAPKTCVHYPIENVGDPFLT